MLKEPCFSFDQLFLAIIAVRTNFFPLLFKFLKVCFRTLHFYPDRRSSTTKQFQVKCKMQINHCLIAESVPSCLEVFSLLLLTCIHGFAPQPRHILRRKRE
jgi:hypothetical protein